MFFYSPHVLCSTLLLFLMWILTLVTDGHLPLSVFVKISSSCFCTCYNHRRFGSCSYLFLETFHPYTSTLSSIFFFFRPNIFVKSLLFDSVGYAGRSKNKFVSRFFSSSLQCLKQFVSSSTFCFPLTKLRFPNFFRCQFS